MGAIVVGIMIYIVSDMVISERTLDTLDEQTKKPPSELENPE